MHFRSRSENDQKIGTQSHMYNPLLNPDHHFGQCLWYMALKLTSIAGWDANGCDKLKSLALGQAGIF